MKKRKEGRDKRTTERSVRSKGHSVKISSFEFACFRAFHSNRLVKQTTETEAKGEERGKRWRKKKA